METKPSISRSIIYAVIGLLLLALSVKDIFVMSAVGILVGACWLAAVVCWERVLILPLVMGLVLVYWRTGSLLFAILTMLVVGGLVYGSYWCMQAKKPIAASVGIPVLIAAVLAVGAFTVYMYIVRGAFDFSGIMPSLSQIKTAIDEAVYDPLLTAFQATQMSPTEIDQAITEILTIKNVYLDAVFTVLPGFAMSVLFVFCWGMQNLARVLLGRKQSGRVYIEPIWKLKMYRPVGVVFILAFILSFLAEGTWAAVAGNLITVFELPLLICGGLTVYALFTRRAHSRGSKALTAVLVILTAVGIPISLSIAYVFVGAVDSIADLRRRLRGQSAPEDENERMKQWLDMREMKPGNDAEASEELDVKNDEDDNEGEDQ